MSGLSSLGFRVSTSTYRQRGYSFKDSFSLVRGRYSWRTGAEFTFYKYAAAPAIPSPSPVLS